MVLYIYTTAYITYSTDMMILNILFGLPQVSYQELHNFSDLGNYCLCLNGQFIKCASDLTS